MKQRSIQSMGGSRSWESTSTLSHLNQASQGQSRTPGRGVLLMLPVTETKEIEVNGHKKTTTTLATNPQGQTLMSPRHGAGLLKMDPDDPIKRWYMNGAKNAGTLTHTISEKGKSRSQVANIKVDNTLIQEAQSMIDNPQLRCST